MQLYERVLSAAYALPLVSAGVTTVHPVTVQVFH